MSNARSPRDVCSITIGISGLIRGVSRLISAPRFRASISSSRCRSSPSRASRASRAPRPARPGSASPRRRSSSSAFFSRRSPRICSNPPRSRRASTAASASSSDLGRLAPDQLLDLLVRDLDRRACPRRPRARARASRRAPTSARALCSSVSGVWPVAARYASADTPRCSSERTSPASSAPVRRSTSGSMPSTVGRLHERVERGLAEAGLEVGVELLRAGASRRRLAAPPASRTRSRRGRARRRAPAARFCLISLRVTVTVPLPSSSRSISTTFVSPSDMSSSASSISSASRPAPSSAT